MAEVFLKAENELLIAVFHIMIGTCPLGQVPFFCLQKKASDDCRAKMLQKMRYFALLFGGSTLFEYLCRRICDVNHCIMLHKVGMRYVYTRKRQLDGLPLGCF